METIPAPEVLEKWREKFPVTHGLDDPRELNAYLVDSIFVIDYSGRSPKPLTPAHLKTIKEERMYLPKLLK